MKKFWQKFSMNIWNEEQGISLVLVIIVLSSVMLLGLAASQIVLREAGSVKGIEQSEIAYYAAEAGAERMLYAYNKQYPRRLASPVTETCTDLDNTGFNLETMFDARWKEIGMVLLTQNSPWTVTIPAGATAFEYSLDLNLDDSLDPAITPYPANLRIQRGGGGAASVVVLRMRNDTGALIDQTMQSNSPFTYVPGPGPSDDFDFTQYHYRIRIVESAGGPRDFTVTTSPANMPLVTGFVVTACGQYKNVSFERRLEASHAKWAIY